MGCRPVGLAEFQKSSYRDDEQAGDGCKESLGSPKPQLNSIKAFTTLSEGLGQSLQFPEGLSREEGMAGRPEGLGT